MFFSERFNRLKVMTLYLFLCTNLHRRINEKRTTPAEPFCFIKISWIVRSLVYLLVFVFSFVRQAVPENISVLCSMVDPLESKDNIWVENEQNIQFRQLLPLIRGKASTCTMSNVVSQCWASQGGAASFQGGEDACPA